MPNYPSRRGPAKKIIPYMSGNQDFIAPIMTNPENIYQLGPNAYGKPAAALNILREVIMGKELFDFAFKTFSNRWMFKHPIPEDFFRTMEDASAVDLDWFWRGWFYSTDVVDIGIKSFQRFYLSSLPGNKISEEFLKYGYSPQQITDVIYMISEKDKVFNDENFKLEKMDSIYDFKQMIRDEFSTQDNKLLKKGKYFYQIEFEKPGGLVMPVIVEFNYKDGSKKIIKYPVQIWRKNENSFKKFIVSEKEIVKVKIDPYEQTADVNLKNNSWPREEEKSDFDIFKSKIRG